MYAAVGGSAIGTGVTSGGYSLEFPRRSLDGFVRHWPRAMRISSRTTNSTRPSWAPRASLEIRPPRRARMRRFHRCPPAGSASAGSRASSSSAGTLVVQEQAIISRDYRGRKACSNRGSCTLRPPFRLALDARRHVLADRTRERCRAAYPRPRTGDHASPTAGPAGSCTTDCGGQVVEARARVVVLCCNGVGTPRLLLTSTTLGHKDGLANSSGLVGSNFMAHGLAVSRDRQVRRRCGGV